MTSVSEITLVVIKLESNVLLQCKYVCMFYIPWIPLPSTNNSLFLKGKSDKIYREKRMDHFVKWCEDYNIGNQMLLSSLIPTLQSEHVGSMVVPDNVTKAAHTYILHNWLCYCIVE